MNRVMLIERNLMVQKLMEFFLSSSSKCQLVHSLNSVSLRLKSVS